MKLASFRFDGQESWGIVDGDGIIDIGAILGEGGPDLRAAIKLGSLSYYANPAADARRRALEAVEWLPVIPRPGKILCVGLNYESHRRETGRPESAHPTIFLRVAASQTGHGAAILRPHVSDKLDYEGELAVIIGKSGRYISRADAMSHVAGYACYNDATLRDWQQHNSQFTPGKNFDGTGAFGPWMVTADEIPDLDALRIATRVNGETVQEAGLDQMIFPVARLIEYCSSFTTLEAGDVIATGTPGGVGFKRDPQLFLKAGDRVEVEITSVGLLVNTIADEPALPH
jgi:2-keto-4-pentenoate hydratase/2-oxohepta-3-ene-1,7-dioic acid hydratase in catechol pathway